MHLIICDNFLFKQASTTHLIEEACSGGSKSETKGASTTSTLGSGYKELVGEHGNSYVPQEALYDQPVSLSTILYGAELIRSLIAAIRNDYHCLG